MGREVMCTHLSQRSDNTGAEEDESNDPIAEDLKGPVFVQTDVIQKRW